MKLTHKELVLWLRSALAATKDQVVYHELPNLLSCETAEDEINGSPDSYIVDHQSYGLTRTARGYAYYWVSNRELFLSRVAEVHGQAETLAALLELET